MSTSMYTPPNLYMITGRTTSNFLMYGYNILVNLKDIWADFLHNFFTFTVCPDHSLVAGIQQFESVDKCSCHLLLILVLGEREISQLATASARLAGRGIS